MAKAEAMPSGDQQPMLPIFEEAAESTSVVSPTPEELIAVASVKHVFEESSETPTEKYFEELGGGYGSVHEGLPRTAPAASKKPRHSSSMQSSEAADPDSESAQYTPGYGQKVLQEMKNYLDREEYNKSLSEGNRVEVGMAAQRTTNIKRQRRKQNPYLN